MMLDLYVSFFFRMCLCARVFQQLVGVAYLHNSPSYNSSSPLPLPSSHVCRLYVVSTVQVLLVSSYRLYVLLLCNSIAEEEKNNNKKETHRKGNSRAARLLARCTWQPGSSTQPARTWAELCRTCSSFLAFRGIQANWRCTAISRRFTRKLRPPQRGSTPIQPTEQAEATASSSTTCLHQHKAARRPPQEARSLLPRLTA